MDQRSYPDLLNSYPDPKLKRSVYILYTLKYKKSNYIVCVGAAFIVLPEIHFLSFLIFNASLLIDRLSLLFKDRIRLRWISARIGNSKESRKKKATKRVGSPGKKKKLFGKLKKKSEKNVATKLEGGKLRP